jgi:hypothetical protein
MTTDLYAGVNGHRCTAVRLTVGNAGPWIADVDFEGEPDVAGRVTLKLGALELVGTIVATATGTFGLQRRARIVAGADGWGAEVAAKQYHNDAGVKGKLVADDAARAVGETIGTFIPASERVGRDYARQVGAASRALEDVIGDVAWWVGYDGVTHVGPRPATPLDGKAYTVLAYDPRDRYVTLAVDDPGAVRIGSILTERLDGAHTVRSFEVRITAEEMRVRAWVGGNETGSGHLAGLLRSIVQRSTDGRLWGHYRYRVVRMAGRRVELQAVRRIVGLPDLLPLSTWPGVAGAHAELAPGAEVLVGFVEGDRAQPVVLAFAGPDAPGFVPTQLTLGGTSGAPVARQGDVVEVQLAPATFAGTVGGAPASGLLTFTPSKALGVITGGSSKVRVS